MRMKTLSVISALLLVGIMAVIACAGTAQSRIVDISANPNGATAIDDNGSLWMWGGFNSSIPYIVQGMNSVIETAGTGQYTLALKDDGTVWFMGRYPRPYNMLLMEYDDIGDPVKVEGTSGITAISCRQNEWLALKDDGTVWVFDPFSRTMQPFMGLSDVRQISQSSGNSVVVRNDGTVITSGRNDHGQLGNGKILTNEGLILDSYNPIVGFTAADMHNVTMAAAGWEFTVALTDDGMVWTWGRGDGGQLGDGASVYSSRGRAYPQRVPGLDHIVAVAAGSGSAYALRDDGTVWAWGDNLFYGMLGDGTFESRSVPVRVAGLSGIVEIAATTQYAMALDKYGNVWAWGRDDYGQLGDGGIHEYGCSATPVLVGFSQSLAGPAIEPTWMVPERPAPVIPGAGAVSTDDGIRYLTISNHDVIYAFSPHELQAYLPDGSLKWNITIPGRWMYADEYYKLMSVDENGHGYMPETAQPIFAAADGYVYLYTLIGLPDDCSVTPGRWEGTDPTKTPVTIVNKSLIAISPDGKIAWTYNLTENIGVEDQASVTVKGDRIYFYHCYNETVLDRSGKVVFSLDNIAAPAAVGNDGTVYAFPAKKFFSSTLARYIDPATNRSADYRAPGSLLEAFSGDGKLIWSKDLGVVTELPYLTRESRNLFGSLPLFAGDRLYVPLASGVMAMDLKGNVLWSDQLDGVVVYPFEKMPMDTEGNLYYVTCAPLSIPQIVIVSPDGKTRMVNEFNRVNISTGFDGMLYEAVPTAGTNSVTVRAFDVRQGYYRWNITLSVGDNHTVLLDGDNVAQYFRDTMDFRPIRAGSGYVWAKVIPSSGLVYVDFRAAAYETPVVLGKSNITYASALIAIDGQSGIVAQLPLDSYTTAVAVNNSTIVYSTGGGGLDIKTVAIGAAAGIAALAAAALLAKFFLFGTVARARSRLDDNINRGSVLKFVVDNPGTTLSEISRDTGMNMGTVRYHVFILKLNHKVRPFKEGKFIRYFPNSNFYSSEEQLVISMMRREPIKDIIRTLTGSPGQTNSDLSRILGQSESAVSEHMKMLCDRGITVKEKSGDGHVLFSVSDEVQATIGHLHERLEQKGIRFSL